MTFDPARLRALAHAATSGPWGSYANDGKGFVYVYRQRPAVMGVHSFPVSIAATLRQADADFIAAASPTAVLDLLAVAEQSSTLFGYFHNACIHESAAALVSLHATKAGAWRAMRAGLFAAAVAERDWALTSGRSVMRDKTLEDELHFIKPVTVHP